MIDLFAKTMEARALTISDTKEAIFEEAIQKAGTKDQTVVAKKVEEIMRKRYGKNFVKHSAKLGLIDEKHILLAVGCYMRYRQMGGREK